MAVVGAICREYGNLAIRLEHRALTAQSFRAFLADLVTIAKVLEPEKKLQVFMDNASIHRARLIIDFAEESGVQLVYNVVRQPAFNGIENFWAELKRRYRQKVVLLMANGQLFSNSSVVMSAYNEVSDEVAVNCARKGVERVMKIYHGLEQRSTPAPDVS